MDIHKLVPWNWFKGEDSEAGSVVPIQRSEEPKEYPEMGLQNQITQLHRKMNQLFDSTFRGFGTPSFDFNLPFSQFINSGLIKPQINIGGSNKEYEVTVEIPGVEEKDMKVEISGNLMTIRGEKNQEKEEKGKSYYRMERSYGSFQRVLSLPEDANQEKVKAIFKNGVLTVSMPRKALPASAVKQIEIKKV
jgi:HSP20 family protein